MSEYERKRFNWLVFKIDTEGEESLTGMEQAEYYFYMDMITEQNLVSGHPQKQKINKAV
jgi:hypothetical protein